MEARELTRAERTAIRKLVTSMCANYDKEYGCLPLDPALEQPLTDPGAGAELRPCAVCGALFVQDGKRAYCSEACAEAARRKRQREYMRQKRGWSVSFCPSKTLVNKGFADRNPGWVI